MAGVETRKLTPAQFYRMPDDGRSLELVDGEVREMANGGWRHGNVVLRLTVLLHGFSWKTGLGEVVAPNTGFLVAGNVRKPDVGFIPADQVVSPRPVTWVPFPPALAVEVVSPSDAWGEVEDKARDYLGAGTREVWIVVPSSRTVHVWRPGAPIRLLQGDDRIETDLLPGFSASVSEFFAGE